MTATEARHRLTQYASGGGCACKIPPGELEDVVRGLTGHASPDLLVGLDDGDDAAVVRIDERTAVVATADFFSTNSSRALKRSTAFACGKSGVGVRSPSNTSPLHAEA